jgi:hypothetical protein
MERDAFDRDLEIHDPYAVIELPRFVLCKDSKTVVQ